MTNCAILILPALNTKLEYIFIYFIIENLITFILHLFNILCPESIWKFIIELKNMKKNNAWLKDYKRSNFYGKMYSPRQHKYNWIERHTFMYAKHCLFPLTGIGEIREGTATENVRATYNMLPLILQTADETVARGCLQFRDVHVSGVVWSQFAQTAGRLLARRTKWLARITREIKTQPRCGDTVYVTSSKHV